MNVTVASGERIFSKLVKTYIRSKLSQERPNNLAILSTENGIVKIIDLGNIFRLCK